MRPSTTWMRRSSASVLTTRPRRLHLQRKIRRSPTQTTSWRPSGACCRTYRAMAIQVLVPVMGEAIGEARLATWLKRVGDPVRRGDELAELETDKAVLMLECPADGVLLEILVPAGAMVTTGQLLAR